MWSCPAESMPDNIPASRVLCRSAPPASHLHRRLWLRMVAIVTGGPRTPSRRAVVDRLGDVICSQLWPPFTLIFHGPSGRDLQAEWNRSRPLVSCLDPCSAISTGLGRPVRGEGHSRLSASFLATQFSLIITNIYQNRVCLY